MVKVEKKKQKPKRKVNKKKSEKKKKIGRKNIRKIIEDCDLSVLTQIAAKSERDRKDRLKLKKEKHRELMIESDQLVLDSEPMISVDKNLVKLLKPHQKQGIQFMWDASYESGDSLRDSTGGGCILAHCMGLGKSFQAIALIHTLMSHSEITFVQNVLILCPKTTILNWVDEFSFWISKTDKQTKINVFNIIE